MRSFQIPLHQNLKRTAAVKFTLGIGMQDGKQVHSVVAFSDRAEFKTPLPAQVCYIRQVAAYLQQFTQSCFSDMQLRQFTARFNMAQRDRKILTKKHLSHMRSGTAG